MLGEAFLPTVTRVVGKLMEWAQNAMPAIEAGMATLSGVVDAVAAPFGRLVGRLEAGYSPLKLLSDAFPRLITPEVREVLVSVSRRIGDIVEALQAGHSPLKILSDLLPTVFTPEVRENIMGIVRGIGRLGEALSDTLGNAISVLVGLWETLWPHLLAVLQPIWEVIVAAIRTGIDVIITVVRGASEIWTQVMELLGSKIVAARNVIEPILQAIGGKFKEIFGQVQPFVAEMMNKIKGWFDENMPLIRETIETVLTKIQQFWVKHGEAVLNALDLAWETIKTVISTALDVVLGIITAVMQIINGDWEGAWETIKGVLKTVWLAIEQILKNALNAILGFFDTDLEKLGENIRAFFSNLPHKIGVWLDEVGAKIVLFGAKALSSIKTPFQEAYDWLKDTWGKIRDFIAHIFDNIKIKTPHFSIKWSEVFGVNIPTGVDVQWYGKGLDAMFNKPTLIGVGEKGAERVQVTPKGRAPSGAGDGGTGNTYHINVTMAGDQVRGLRDMVTLLQMAG